MNIEIGLAGAFMMERCKAHPDNPLLPIGPMECVSPWTDNVITDVGLNNIGVSTLGNHIMRGCQVGSGNTPPSTGDTALVSRLGSTVERIARWTTKQMTTLPYYLDVFTTYRFAAGVGTGDIKELATVTATNDGGSTGALSPTAAIFSRTLPVDGSGNPTTVTKLADEIVDVTYRLRYYIDTTDKVEERVVDGVTYTLTLRPVRLEQQPSVNNYGFGYYSNSTSASAGNVDSFYGRQSGGYGENAVYVGAAAAIGPISGGDPTGTKSVHSESVNPMTMSNEAYVTNSYELEQVLSLGLGTANAGYNNADGIGCVVFSNSICSWQIGITPRMVKTSDELASFSVFTKWARA